MGIISCLLLRRGITSTLLVVHCTTRCYSVVVASLKYFLVPGSQRIFSILLSNRENREHRKYFGNVFVLRRRSQSDVR